VIPSRLPRRPLLVLTMFPDYLRSVITYIAQLYRRLFTEPQIQARAYRQFADLPRARVAEAIDYARVATIAARNANQLGLSQRLIEALGDREPPFTQVRVYMTARIQDDRGDSRWITISTDVPWTTTMGEVYQKLLGGIDQLLRRYGYNRIIDAQITTPLIIPPGGMT
jgi:hypothetical protein